MGRGPGWSSFSLSGAPRFPQRRAASPEVQRRRYAVVGAQNARAAPRSLLVFLSVLGATVVSGRAYPATASGVVSVSAAPSGRREAISPRSRRSMAPTSRIVKASWPSVARSTSSTTPADVDLVGDGDQRELAEGVVGELLEAVERLADHLQRDPLPAELPDGADLDEVTEGVAAGLALGAISGLVRRVPAGRREKPGPRPVVELAEGHASEARHLPGGEGLHRFDSSCHRSRALTVRPPQQLSVVAKYPCGRAASSARAQLRPARPVRGGMALNGAPSVVGSTVPSAAGSVGGPGGGSAAGSSQGYGAGSAPPSAGTGDSELPASAGELTYTIADAAQAVGVHPQTIRKRIKAGRLQAALVEGPNGPEYRIPVGVVHRLAAEAMAERGHPQRQRTAAPSDTPSATLNEEGSTGGSPDLGWGQSPTLHEQGDAPSANS